MLQIFKYLSLSLFFTQAFAQAPQVAITQIVAHPSLDKIRQGILDELIEQNLIQKDLSDIVYQNAQGNIIIAAQIAQRFVALRPKVIVAITTPSAQTMLKATKDTLIPIVFGAVTDPVGAGLITQLQNHKERITGTIDLPSPKAQLSLVKKMLPALRKIGLIYNPSEINSQKQVKAIKEVVSTFGVEIEEAPAFKTADVAQATSYLVGKVEAILLLNDNTTISALKTVIKSATKGGVPVFASDPESVKGGALAAIANDQYEVGRKTGSIVATILKGKDIKKIDIQIVNASKHYFNDKALKHFDLKNPMLNKE
jgi:putative ABC transport system substrate-binding protein